MNSVLGLLGGLTISPRIDLSRNKRASILNIGNFNVLISDCNCNALQPAAPIALPADDRPSPGSQGASETLMVAVNHDSEIVDGGGTTHEPPTNAVSHVLLPITTGIYLRFSEPSWWETAPRHVDITPNIRLLSVTEVSHRFPSIEAGMGRPIEIAATDESFCIRRDHDSMRFAIALASKMPDSGVRCDSWSLCPLDAGRITRLPVENISVIVEYHRDVVSSMWCLVNHHRTRGREVYVVLIKPNG